MSDTAGTIVTIFREALGIEVPASDFDVIESGLLDSLGLVTLVDEIEQRVGVTIPFETLEIDDFRTVESIGRVVDAERSRIG